MKRLFNKIMTNRYHVMVKEGYLPEVLSFIRYELINDDDEERKLRVRECYNDKAEHCTVIHFDATKKEWLDISHTLAVVGFSDVVEMVV